MKIDKLNWDSNFFNINIGKIQVDDEKNFSPNSFMENVKKENYQLVYVFKYDKLFSNKIIQRANLDLVDIQITMSQMFIKNKFLNKFFDFRTELTKKEKDECYKIAERTAIVSRFYNEKLIGKEKTKFLYHKWIDNALNQTYSDGLFIHKIKGVVSGIHIIKTDLKNSIGYCTLIGVNPEFKQKGIGRSLWEESFGYWANNNINFIKVPFSLFNRESFNFHLKMGFNKIEEIKYIYHYRNY